MVKNKLTLYVLSILSGLLLWLSWPPFPFTFLIFFAFVPLLIIEDHFRQKPGNTFFQVAGYSYLTFFIWNIFTTYWIYNSTLVGATFAFFANALLMTIPFALFHLFSKVFQKNLSYLSIIVFWVCFEYIHLNWELTWPWLTLGNIFSKRPDWVQWYEFTGVFGGTIWIWILNILIFRFLINLIKKNKKPLIGLGFGMLAVLSIPIIFSIIIKPDISHPNEKVEVVVVQPNVDPYNEKFEPKLLEEQVNRLIRLSDSLIGPKTKLVVWPETAIAQSIDEDAILQDPMVQKIDSFLNLNPQIALVTGANTYKLYAKKETVTARKSKYNDVFFDVFNTAIFFGLDRKTEVYHKSILVPGVEKMPYPKIFGFLERFAINLGGTSGSLGQQDEASIFTVSENLKLAPVICYESVFGDYVGDFINLGANLIVIITNDGWWGNTEGYKQHFQYAVLRAIEARRSIARSANTGISGFILPDGSIKEKTKYWTEDARKQSIPLYSKKTFYVTFGDYLGRVSLFLSVIIILIGIVRLVIMKKDPFFLK